MKKMKKLILMLLSIVSFSYMYGHANADRNNKCRNDRRYCIKTSVNGPSCKKDKLKDKSCSGVSDTAQLFHDWAAKSCACNPNNSYLYTAAMASAKSNASECWSKCYKTDKCKGYKAGSNTNSISFANYATINSNQSNGGVEAAFQANSQIFNYVENKIILSDLSGLLKINSADLFNEYAILKLEIIRIGFNLDSTENELEIIHTSSAQVVNGIFSANGVFTANMFSDFSNSNILEHVLSASYITIDLGFDIVEEGDYKVRLSTDVGNLEDGQPEILTSNFTMQMSVNPIDAKLLVTLNSAVTQSVSLATRSINNSSWTSMGNISLIANEEKIVELSMANLSPNILYLLMANGQNNTMQIKQFIK